MKTTGRRNGEEIFLSKAKTFNTTKLTALMALGLAVGPLNPPPFVFVTREMGNVKTHPYGVGQMPCNWILISSNSRSNEKLYLPKTNTKNNQWQLNAQSHPIPSHQLMSFL